MIYNDFPTNLSNEIIQNLSTAYKNKHSMPSHHISLLTENEIEQSISKADYSFIVNCLNNISEHLKVLIKNAKTLKQKNCFENILKSNSIDIKALNNGVSISHAPCYCDMPPYINYRGCYNNYINLEYCLLEKLLYLTLFDCIKPNKSICSICLSHLNTIKKLSNI